MIVDATFGEEDLQRAFVEDLGEHGPLLVIECVAPAEVRIARAAARASAGDSASDAGPPVARALGERFTPTGGLPDDASLAVDTRAPDRPPGRRGGGVAGHPPGPRERGCGACCPRRRSGAARGDRRRGARHAARLVGRGQLPDRRSDLSAGERAAARAAAARAHQAPPARPLGDVARAQPRSTRTQPADPRARRQRDLRRRARARRSRVVAYVYLEGTYSEIYPRRHRRTKPGCGALFRQFSTPGGIPSHVSVRRPGSIHEGGELGYVARARLRRRVRQPRPHRRRVVGDGEAETGPLEGIVEGHPAS